MLQGLNFVRPHAARYIYPRMLTSFIKFGDGRLSTDTDEKTLAAAARDPKATFWLDMNKPTDEELSLLDDVFGFHPLAIEDTIQPRATSTW
jgi:magnesium transporter